MRSHSDFCSQILQNDKIVRETKSSMCNSCKRKWSLFMYCVVWYWKYNSRIPSFFVTLFLTWWSNQIGCHKWVRCFLDAVACTIALFVAIFRIVVILLLLAYARLANAQIDLFAVILYWSSHVPSDFLSATETKKKKTKIYNEPIDCAEIGYFMHTHRVIGFFIASILLIHST